MPQVTPQCRQHLMEPMPGTINFFLQCTCAFLFLEGSLYSIVVHYIILFCGTTTMADGGNRCEWVPCLPTTLQLPVPQPARHIPVCLSSRAAKTSWWEIMYWWAFCPLDWFLKMESFSLQSLHNRPCCSSFLVLGEVKKDEIEAAVKKLKSRSRVKYQKKPITGRGRRDDCDSYRE